VTTALLAGGGTAGHVNPLLALADHWRDREPETSILALGTAEGLEARLVPERGYELLTIPRVPFPRKPNATALRFPGALRGAIDAVRVILRERNVDVVVGFGGYAAAPAYLAARLESVPIVAHEANARPGIANRLAGWLGGRIGTTFPGTPVRGAQLVGMPLRREIVELDRRGMRPDAHRHFELDADRPTLLVTGGSTGAKRLNETVSVTIAHILGSGWNVVHITGRDRGGADPGLPGYRVMEYCDRMELAFAAAELVVCRSGSATVSELAALGLPSVLVPYPVGNGEQRLNARELVDSGGAILVDDARFTPDFVVGTLVPLLDSRAEIARMAAATHAVGRRDGSAALLKLIHDTLDSADRVG
jgi:UDP-N-acetylglucosamine--N-acetylmuramyl-(pentapeptide) pyrophosphoryl-undecaprenol N-acetylglucosamine transferase